MLFAVALLSLLVTSALEDRLRRCVVINPVEAAGGSAPDLGPGSRRLVSRLSRWEPGSDCEMASEACCALIFLGG